MQWCLGVFYRVQGLETGSLWGFFSVVCAGFGVWFDLLKPALESVDPPPPADAHTDIPLKDRTTPSLKNWSHWPHVWVGGGRSARGCSEYQLLLVDGAGGRQPLPTLQWPLGDGGHAAGTCAVSSHLPPGKTRSKNHGAS